MCEICEFIERGRTLWAEHGIELTKAEYRKLVLDRAMGELLWLKIYLPGFFERAYRHGDLTALWLLSGLYLSERLGVDGKVVDQEAI
jgi:hypothetical protein